MKKLLFFLLVNFLCAFLVKAQNSIDFEDLVLEPESHWNGSDGSGFFTCGYLKFYNDFEELYSTWIGFAFTNETDNITYSWQNMYSSASGNGVNASSNYVVSYIGADYENDYSPIPAVLKIDREQAPASFKGMYISLNANAALYMADNNFYKEQKHWMYLYINAINTESLESASRTIMLADYRFTEEEGYKLDEWSYIDMSWANGMDSISFIIKSSDAGDYGINTPSYFCMDDFCSDIPVNTPDMIAEVKASYNINSGEFVNLGALVKGGVQPYYYSWSTEAGLDDYYSQFPQASPTLTTNYTLTISDAIGNQIIRNVTVNVNNGNVNILDNTFENLSIYKNTDASISILNQHIIDKLSIYDITGKLHMAKENNTNSITINTNNLPKSVYFIRISSNGSEIIKKIII